MLRITIELLPGGRESLAKEIAVAEIHRVAGTSVADYQVVLHEEFGGTESARITQYPRWSTSIWDLVARGIAKALTGRERLLRRPVPLRIKIRESGGCKYVRLGDIPEPMHTAFGRNIEHSTCPIIEDDLTPRECAFAHDWLAFLAGER